MHPGTYPGLGRQPCRSNGGGSARLLSALEQGRRALVRPSNEDEGGQGWLGVSEPRGQGKEETVGGGAQDRNSDLPRMPGLQGAQQALGRGDQSLGMGSG